MLRGHIMYVRGSYNVCQGVISCMLGGHIMYVTGSYNVC